MNREDVIRMAEESGIVSEAYDSGFMNLFTAKLERFAALVASAERESLRESFRVVTAAEASAAILHEREACAKVCDRHSTCKNDTADVISVAIRARGSHD